MVFAQRVREDSRRSDSPPGLTPIMKEQTFVDMFPVESVFVPKFVKNLVRERSELIIGRDAYCEMDVELRVLGQLSEKKGGKDRANRVFWRPPGAGGGGR